MNKSDRERLRHLKIRSNEVEDLEGINYLLCFQN